MHMLASLMSCTGACFTYCSSHVCRGNDRTPNTRLISLHGMRRLVEKAEGKVPVIQDGDMLLADSDKIVEYLEQKYPEPAFKSGVPADM